MAKLSGHVTCPVEDFEMAYPCGAVQVFQNRVMVFSNEVIERKRFEDHSILRTKDGGQYKVPHCWSGNSNLDETKANGIVSPERVVSVVKFKTHEIITTSSGKRYRLELPIKITAENTVTSFTMSKT